MATKKYTSDGEFVTIHGGVGGKKKMPAREFEEALTLPYRDPKGRRLEKPPSGGSTYVDIDTPEYGGPPVAGAGRGKQGGPTAKELADYEKKLDADIYTKEKGKPPQDEDGGSAPMKKMASGGSVGSASKRADGCAIRGKTRA